MNVLKAVGGVLAYLALCALEGVIWLFILFAASRAFADVAINGGEVNCQISDGGAIMLGADKSAVDVRNNGRSVGRALVGMDELLWYHPVEGTVIDSNLLEGTAVTMTVAQAVATGITFNSGSGTAANTNVRESSVRKFAFNSDKPIVARWNFRRTITGQANEVVEMGFFNATVAVAPTDGAFFRWNAAGNFVAVTAFNSTEVTSATLTSPSINVWHTATVVTRQLTTLFYVDDVLVSTLTAGSGDPGVFSTQRISLSWRVYIAAATPGAAPQLQIGKGWVFEEGAGTRDKETALAQFGRGAYQSPITTFAQTANHANSTSPTSATLSNTAAGYTTLGGRYQFAAVASAATDFALFGFQVPAGYTLNITNVRITTCNTGAAITTTATLFDWGVAVNSSAVSLATADALGPPATAWAPRRIPLGTNGFPLVAPNGPGQIGECADQIIRDFGVPLVVDQNRFFHVILQVPLGSATASQIFRGDVTVTGWFE